MMLWDLGICTAVVCVLQSTERGRRGRVGKTVMHPVDPVGGFVNDTAIILHRPSTAATAAQTTQSFKLALLIAAVRITLFSLLLCFVIPIIVHFN